LLHPPLTDRRGLALLFGSGFITHVMSLHHVDPEAGRTDPEIWIVELL
jgi:MOSC N-terminal beta barrel domain